MRGKSLRVCSWRNSGCRNSHAATGASTIKILKPPKASLLRFSASSFIHVFLLRRRRILIAARTAMTCVKAQIPHHIKHTLNFLHSRSERWNTVCHLSSELDPDMGFDTMAFAQQALLQQSLVHLQLNISRNPFSAGDIFVLECTMMA